MRKHFIMLLLVIYLCSASSSANALSMMDYITGQQAFHETEDNQGSSFPSGKDAAWSIYWYLCGSDLESYYGCATDDLNEMMEAELPENVQVVIQTGGAEQWQNDTVESGCIERYVYDSNGLEFIEQQPQANMGDAQTLEIFCSSARRIIQRSAPWSSSGTMAAAAFPARLSMKTMALIP